MSDEQASGGQGGQDDDARKRRIALIAIAVVGVVGYLCLALATSHGGQEPSDVPGSAALRRLTGVHQEELTLLDADGASAAWSAPGRFAVAAGSSRQLAVAERDSLILEVRSLGLRFRPAVGSAADAGQPALRIVYQAAEGGGAAADELRDRIAGEKNAIDIPRKARDEEDAPDLLSASLPLLMVSGTVTVSNTGDIPVAAEIY